MTPVVLHHAYTTRRNAGNHDNPRVATRLGGERPARAALALLFSLPGTPTVYNGEELAMSNVALRDDQVRDPAALRQPRELWPLVGRDPERTPMQWNASRAAGFLPADAPPEAMPWLPLAPDAEVNNVAAQAANATSTLNLFKALSTLRLGEPALRGAPLVPLDWGGSDDVPDGVVAFARPLRCACGNISAVTAATAEEPGAYLHACMMSRFCTAI
jgi:alpha-glucosidase